MNTLLRPLLLLSLCLGLATSALAEPVWIDVRTVEEVEADHIEGDVNIPLAELDGVKLATMYDKDSDIRLYCRSGRRAQQALELLQSAGFTNVHNEGGIDDVRQTRKAEEHAGH